MTVPTYDKLFNPLLIAMKNLGGSARNEEIQEEVARNLKLTEDEINEIHKGNRTKLDYRLAWARNYLKRYGLLASSARGVWYLTPEGMKIDKVDINDVKKKAKQETVGNSHTTTEEIYTDQLDSKHSETWEDRLIYILKNMNPYAFERLSQRILKESGFENVEVTKKSGDGGIDGKGTLKIGGLVSFNVYFQSKRYEGTVPSSVIRDFRGAIMGRADKGIIITTGIFSKDAKLEARRDGAIMIDLIDGIALTHILKEYNLGVNIIEQVQIDENWFNEI